MAESPERAPADSRADLRRVEIDRRPILVVAASRLRRQLVLGALLALFLWLVGLAPPAGLSPQGWATICIFGLCVTLWATALLPLAITSLMAIAFIPLFGVLEAGEAYRYFGSKVVFFILGAFMLSAALVGSGLSKRVATVFVRRFGRTPRKLIISVFLLCATAATVMSSHAVAAMVFPIVLDIARALKLRPLRSRMGMALMFALAWGSIIGGSLTVLGGGRGPLAIGILEESMPGQTIGFVDFTLFALPMVLLMLVGGAALLLWRFPPEVARTDDAIDALEASLHEMGKMSIRERVVGLAVLVTVGLWAFAGDELGIANIAICAMAALFALGVVAWREVEENVNWGVIVMYGGAICLGGAMGQSGAAEWITRQLLGSDGGLSGTELMLTLAGLSALLTEFMSNSAVVAVLVPAALPMAPELGVSPAAVTMSIVLPSNFAFMFPVSTPVTAIAWSAGYYTPRQVAGTGLLLHLVGYTCMVILITLYWPLMGLV